MILKKDIQNKDDIKILVDSFYKKVIKDNTIGYIFNDIIKDNWDKHLSIMYDFWASILLSDRSYSGNPLMKHLNINQQIPLKEAHFNRWVELWKLTLDEHFLGRNADSAKIRAGNIKNVMLSHINRNA